MSPSLDNELESARRERELAKTLGEKLEETLKQLNEVENENRKLVKFLKKEARDLKKMEQPREEHLTHQVPNRRGGQANQRINGQKTFAHRGK